MKSKLKLILITLSLITVFQIHQSRASSNGWTIVQTYTIPGKASGLAWDGTYLYYGIYGANGDKVYRFNPGNGTTQLQFSNPAIGDSYGMTYDDQHLWIIDRGSTGPSYALKLDLNGNIVSQFTLPNQYMSGIAYDNGNFWVGTYYPNPGWIHKVNNSGTVLTQFVPPYEQPWDICLQGEYLWIVDYNANKINKVDQTGNILEEHPAQNQRPAGIVFDGTYIWYVDGPLGANSTLYKVNPGGAGTPAIQIPATTHNFGNVTVGTTATWNMLVQSTGTAPLEVSNILFPPNFPVYSTATFPVTIQAGQSMNIPIVYAPQNAGPLNGNAQVVSNDPVNPSVTITLTGFGVIDGPNLHVPVANYNYGTIRKGATKMWKMEVQNTGNATLTINSLEVDDPNFYIEDNFSLPISLAPLGQAYFNIWFWPGEGIAYEATLSIFSNDPDNNPFLVGLTGAGQDGQYPIGTVLWQYYITTSYDNSPKAIHYIPDINGDGVADVIICSEDNYIRCFNGNASGAGQILWEREIYSGSIYQQSGLTLIEDINNDGYVDVIVGTAWGDRSVVALSGKTGEILWKHQTNNYGGGGWVYQVDTRFDYNNDGFPDVLAATGNDGNNTGPRRIYCLDGKTGNPIWESFLGAAAFAVIGVEDFTGDGIPDVIAGGTNPGETQGRVIGINGANGSIQWTYTTSGSAVWALESLDDINGDGIPDVIAGSFNGNYYLINPVNGAVLHQGYLGNNIITRFAKLDDVNNDGYSDIFPGHSGTVAIMINGFNGSNIWTKSLPDKPWNVARIPDVSGNNINDLVVGTLYQNNFIYFLKGTDGTDLFSQNFGEAVDAIGVIPDITGDLSWEMVAGGRNGKVVCYSGGLNTFVGIIDQPENPSQKFSVSCYPNPFLRETKLSINLPLPGRLMINIYDITGTLVWRYDERYFAEGSHEISWAATRSDGSKLNQGIYIYEIKFHNRTTKGKIIFMGE